MRIQFEYKQIKIEEGKILIEELNREGEDGWEVVYFKEKVEEFYENIRVGAGTTFEAGVMPCVSTCHYFQILFKRAKE